MDGNMTYRTDATGSYSQTFDVQNRLTIVTHVLAPSASADTQTLSVTQFVYNGDGNRVLAVYPDDSKTAYAGEHYEEHFSMVDESDTLQPGSSGVNSYVDGQNPNSNYGNSSSLYFGNELSMMGGGSTRQKRFLVEFDLSDIPENATVDQAVLMLYCAKSQTGSDLSVNLYRAIHGPSPSTIAGSWTETGITWKCKACWERSEQCNQPAVSTSSEGTITVNSTSLSVYTVSLTSLVPQCWPARVSKGWADGSWDNRGVMAKMATAGLGYKEGYCVSSDSGTASQRPKLEVDWHGAGDSIYRSYYHLGGRRIALRVEEDEADDVYWLHTNHLGSTSLLSDENGGQETGTIARFLPFGDYRTEPDSDLTDKGFTGHVHDAYIWDGLIKVGGRTIVELGEAYQHQGANTNDCGPANLAMILNIQFREAGIDYQVSGHDLGEAMLDGLRRIGTLGGILGYRFNQLWSDTYEGATPPWGMVMAYQEFNSALVAAGYPELGTMDYHYGGTKDELLDNLESGTFSTLMIVRADGTAHYVTVVGYDPSEDEFYLLDLWTGGDKTRSEPQDRILIEGWAWQDENWSRQPLWLGFRNRTIIETQSAQ